MWSTITNWIEKFVEWFKSISKYKNLENSIVQDLKAQFRLYQSTKDEKLLIRLIAIVDFCNINHINGRTNEIKKEIEKYWEQYILSVGIEKNIELLKSRGEHAT